MEGVRQQDYESDKRQFNSNDVQCSFVCVCVCVCEYMAATVSSENTEPHVFHESQQKSLSEKPYLTCCQLLIYKYCG